MQNNFQHELYLPTAFVAKAGSCCMRMGFCAASMMGELSDPACMLDAAARSECLASASYILPILLLLLFDFL